MFKRLYRHFLEAHPGQLHFTAHSHHFWPDVTRDAQLRYWDDSARYLDGKWDRLFAEVIPETQRLIAGVIGTTAPGQIVFGESTHEFVCRLLSCFEGGKPLAVLTTDSEFHSLRRQLQRLAEYSWVSVDKVPVEPFSTFEQRLLEQAGCRNYQVIFLSQVFFNSGYAIDASGGLIDRLIEKVPADAMVVLDGYHGFCALPTVIQSFSQRVFYMAGGYKYAQAGEGACFLHVPPHCQLRPSNTGWFAEFSALSSSPAGDVGYPDNGQRFAGATFDPSGIYRLRAVLGLFDNMGIGIETIHYHVKRLQTLFLQHLDTLGHAELNRGQLLLADTHGHFFVFRLSSEGAAAQLGERLKARAVFVDVRGNRLRFGFGLYHDREDVDALFDRLEGL
ncbi:MAG: aminotransferase class V-fold PLP-dependent enzyme [Pseudomonadota bacterium]